MRHALVSLLLLWGQSVYGEDFYSFVQLTDNNIYRIDKKSVEVELYPPVTTIYQHGPFSIHQIPFGEERRRIVFFCILDPGSTLRFYKKEKGYIFAEIASSSTSGPTIRPCEVDHKKIRLSRMVFDTLRRDGVLNFIHN